MAYEGDTTQDILKKCFDIDNVRLKVITESDEDGTVGAYLATTLYNNANLDASGAATSASVDARGYSGGYNIGVKNGTDTNITFQLEGSFDDSNYMGIAAASTIVSTGTSNNIPTEEKWPYIRTKLTWSGNPTTGLYVWFYAV